MQNTIIEGLNPMHYLLAYAGMIIHILMKLADVFPLHNFSYKKFIKENIIPTIISIIGIPVLLIISTDTALSEILPINYVTAVLCGWQTQSLFKSVFALYSNRKGLSGNGNGGNSGNSNPSGPDSSGGPNI